MLRIICPLGKDPTSDRNPHHHHTGRDGDVEDVAHVVLVAGEVDLVSVVVVACEHLEGPVHSWSKFGLAFLGKAVLVKV